MTELRSKQDRSIKTDKQVMENQLDIAVVDRVAEGMDVTVLDKSNIRKKENENTRNWRNIRERAFGEEVGE